VSGACIRAHDVGFDAAQGDPLPNARQDDPSPDARPVGIGGNDAGLIGVAETCAGTDITHPFGSACKNH